MEANPLFFLVPEDGIEPSRSQAPGDFESPASTSFTTPAFGVDYRGGLPVVKKIVLTTRKTVC